MAKRKIGVSLIAMFAMVLVFSISAMAAGVLNLDAKVVNGNIEASWDALGDATQYTYTVTDITDTEAPVLIADQLTTTETTISVAVAESKKYEVKIESDSVLSPDEVTVEIWAPASNKEITSTDADNNIGNANQTGTGATDDTGASNETLIKSVDMYKNDGSQGTHRTHGEYQNNTNSCASCHQTHTGASKSLLFKDGVYNTCTACHDGTLGFYNVFNHSNAGTFGGTETGNMSIHLADGSVEVKAAPGGNLSANSGGWVNEFNCASCHSPHGSYSERLLHYNPNGMGRASMDEIDGKSEGGIGLKGESIFTYDEVFVAKTVSAGSKGVPGVQGKTILVKGTAKEFGLSDDPATTEVVEGDGLAETDVVVRVAEMKANNYGANSWVVSKAPWLYGYDYSNPNKNYWTRFYETPTDVAKADPADPKKSVAGADGVVDNHDQFWVIAEADGTKHYQFVVDNHDQDWNANLHIEWSKGYIYATDTTLDNVTSGDVARAYTVDLDLETIAMFGGANGVPIAQSNVNSLYDGTLKGEGVKMSTYCASCHTDYLAHSGSATGTWNDAYRHSTDSDSYTCVRCHYAHGTDVTVMMDAEGRDVDQVMTDEGWDVTQATNYMLDQNPSSALKRYTNMSVCWGCHTDSKAEQLKNTSTYDKTEDPHGLGDQPAMPGKIKQPAIDNGSMTGPDGISPVDPINVE